MTDANLPAVLDGTLVPGGVIQVHALGGGFQHGEGLFETLPLVGGVPYFFSRHYRRLAASSEELDFSFTSSESDWRADLQMLVDAVPGLNLAVRLFVFRDLDCHRRLVAASPLPADLGEPARVGFAAEKFQGPRALPHLKTMNYLVSRLAWREGRERGFDEMLLTLPYGNVLEGTQSNIFLVKNGVLRTAPDDLPILRGVTREVLIEIAAAAGTELRLEAFSVAELHQADEAFLTSSLRGVRPVREIAGGPRWDVPGPVTAKLGELYRARLPGS